MSGYPEPITEDTLRRMEEQISKAMESEESLRGLVGIVRNMARDEVFRDQLRLALMHDSPEKETLKEGLARVGNDLVIVETLEAIGLNLLRLRGEVERALAAIGSETISKEEMTATLETIRNELAQKAPSEEDMKNLEWIRNYLRKSSQAGGQGS